MENFVQANLANDNPPTPNPQPAPLLDKLLLKPTIKDPGYK